MELKEEIGFVAAVDDYLLHLEGLPSAKPNDLLTTESGGKALVNLMDSRRVMALMLDNERPKPGDTLHLSDKGINLPLGNFLLGRTINPLGLPIDGKGVLPLDGPKLELEVVAPGIDDRDLITDQLQTGFMLIDGLLPIGIGQRELIMGEARSAKSTFLLDLIINQKNRNMICVYAAIGKPEIDVKRFAAGIIDSGAGAYTTIVAATSSQAAPLIQIAPSTAFSVAEFFRDRGHNVLLILDDLGLHARYLREIGLLSRQIPGRESYPGGIFYAHSHLMERAGRFNQKRGGGTITLLPVIETGVENMSNLIPTNLMSQTDGHLLFSASLASQGYYPSVDWSRSVTRVGRQTQGQRLKDITSRIRALLAEYKELEGYTKFETELSAETQTKIRQAQMMAEFSRQEPGQIIEIESQIIILSLIFSSFLKDKNADFVAAHKKKIIEAARRAPELEDLKAEAGKDAPLEDFLSLLETKTPFFENLCR